MGMVVAASTNMLTGPEKAVVFILSLEEKLAAPIVAELTEEELKKLRLVASTMREVKSDALDSTYRDFVERASKAVAVPRGGLPYLRRLTVRAIGEDRARNVFEEGTESPLSRLEAAEPDTIASLLAKEPPQLAAAVLARLDPAAASLVLGAMPAERQAIVMTRVTRLTELPASTLEEVAGALAAELPTGEGATTLSMDGMARAAAILNAAPKEIAVGVLSTIEAEQPELSRDLRLAMFTFGDLTRLDPKAMRTTSWRRCSPDSRRGRRRSSATSSSSCRTRARRTSKRRAPRSSRPRCAWRPKVCWTSGGVERCERVHP
jgi:flagellar motor switch protein FliG